MKLIDIASRIDAHLKRFLRNPKINAPSAAHAMTRPYFGATATVSGTRIFVTYISYQGESSLTKAEALAYLAWLDAGNVGRHYDQQRAANGADDVS